MDAILERYELKEDGIFSTLTMGQNAFPCLEHAYFGTDGWLPKIPPGKYSCVRGLHRLESMTEDFETFEITGVQGHTNLLFHPGNTENDSEGCVLIGTTRVKDFVENSRAAFAQFMEIQKDVTQFSLLVINP